MLQTDNILYDTDSKVFNNLAVCDSVVWRL